MKGSSNWCIKDSSKQVTKCPKYCCASCYQNISLCAHNTNFEAFHVFHGQCWLLSVAKAGLLSAANTSLLSAAANAGLHFGWLSVGNAGCFQWPMQGCFNRAMLACVPTATNSGCFQWPMTGIFRVIWGDNWCSQ